jgi:outer membrane protein assembly factor BamB
MRVSVAGVGRVAGLLAIWLALAGPASGQLKAGPGEWPGWRGADRTGVSKETGLLKSWPEGGPKLVWKATGLGKGFSTPSLAQGRIYLLGTVSGEPECLIALDGASGRMLWSTPFGNLDGGHPGPRSTPTFDDGRLYVISSDGKLLCADAESGKEIWKKDLAADFHGERGSWAYAESPLVDGDRVICTPGGEQATVVALDKKKGETIWTCPIRKDAPGRKRSYSSAAYSSAMAAEIGGVRQYVQFLDGGVVGVSAADGKWLWSYDHPASPTANCTTPVIRGDLVLAASAYNTGGGAARIVAKDGKFSAEELWFLPDLQNHHGGLVLVGDCVYGTGASELFCVEFETGRVQWRDRSVGKGSITAADGHLYVRSENGPVALVEASRAGYVEKGRFDQPDRSGDKSWPHPVIAGGRLYLRDQDVLLCYDVKAPEAAP